VGKAEKKKCALRGGSLVWNLQVPGSFFMGCPGPQLRIWNTERTPRTPIDALPSLERPGQGLVPA